MQNRQYRLAGQAAGQDAQARRGNDAAGQVDILIADLRETHRRRPRLQQEFARYRLARRRDRTPSTAAISLIRDALVTETTLQT